jgi:diadenosine tetraphosphate (Ap4A) HIT family hydrolase
MREACQHCPGGYGLKYPLFESKRFLIVCDSHPLTEGHILIITKKHLKCAGALPAAAFSEYKTMYKLVLDFLEKTYGKAAVFEYGVTGQTVFHAHTHFLPYQSSIAEIVPEKSSLKKIPSVDSVRKEYNKNKKYLYVAINNDHWLVDTKIGVVGFLRARFAKVLGAERRGNWKEARRNTELMNLFQRDIHALKRQWENFSAD